MTKILILEDNDFDFELVERKVKILDSPCVVKRAINESEFRNILKDFSPDLILSDFSMPSFSGLEALKIAKIFYSDIPFIFVSGTIGEELAVETLKQGANDYVLKDNLNKLEPAIKRALSEAKEKEQRKDAEDKLQVKIDELRMLIYRISHDIRGPISTMTGIVNLIWDTKSKDIEESLNYVNLIEHEVKKLDSIILNLSSFHYIYDNEIKSSNINFQDFFEELKETLSLIDGYTEIKINITINQKIDFFSDPKLLFSVFYNLIHNAIIFSDREKSEKIINCDVKFTGFSMEASIEDNGIGIPDEIKEKIFNMFYRGSSFSKGAGLGLFIVKTVMDQLHGVLKIESKEKVGTKVYLSIPSAFSPL
jgi:signal transduction histidine kinase